MNTRVTELSNAILTEATARLVAKLLAPMLFDNPQRHEREGPCIAVAATPTPSATEANGD